MVAMILLLQRRSPQLSEWAAVHLVPKKWLVLKNWPFQLKPTKNKRNISYYKIGSCNIQVTEKMML